MNYCVLAVILGTVILNSGCETSPHRLAMISAGYTGCPIEQNVVMHPKLYFEGMSWSVRCGKAVYTCTSVSAGSDKVESRCAPARNPED